MIFLYAINITLCLILSTLPVVYLSRYLKLGFINPMSIQYFINLPFLLFATIVGPLFILDKGLEDGWFNFAIFMENIQLTCTMLTTLFCVKLVSKSFYLKYRLINIFGSCEIRNARMLLASLIFLILYFVAFLLLTKNVGLVNWVANPREAYQYSRAGAGHWYALSILFLSVSYVLMIVYSSREWKAFLLFFFYLPLVYILGSKGFVLSFSIFFIIYLWFARSKLLFYSFYLIPVLAFALLLLNFNATNLLAVINYFDFYVNSARYYEMYSNGEINLFYGYIWLSDFYQYLPRALYPEKPFVYGITNVNEFLFPGAAEETHTPSFGGPVRSFAEFGILGVILSSLFNPLTFINIVLMFNIYSRGDLCSIRMRSNTLYMFIWAFAPSFLVFFGAIYSVIIFGVIMIILSVINRLKF